MNEINKRLDKVRELLKDPDFLEGKGISNEINIRIFCYDPVDEMAVRHFVEQITDDSSLPCRVIENNLYEIFLSCCREKKILDRMDIMEEKKGKGYLLRKIKNAVDAQYYIKKICDNNPKKGDVLLLTGVGDVFPFMRIHFLLENLQEEVLNVPILVMYPGVFDGTYLKLFNRFNANSCYRPFNVV